MKKFDLSAIMCKAWKLYRKGVAAFSECLHRAWNSAKAEPINAQRIEEAQQAAGVAEPVNTWAGWKAAGYMVEHGAKALFQAVLMPMPPNPTACARMPKATGLMLRFAVRQSAAMP